MCVFFSLDYVGSCVPKDNGAQTLNRAERTATARRMRKKEMGSKEKAKNFPKALKQFSLKCGINDFRLLKDIIYRRLGYMIHVELG